jgi:molybdopterin converting factor small subunit
MRVKLLYFGVLKDIAGEADVATDLPDGSTVDELLRILRNRMSNSGTSNNRAGNEMTEQVWRSLAVAVNREYATAGAVLCEGDEVALLPPVSGGCCTSQGLKPRIFGAVDVRAKARTYLRCKSDGNYVG